MDSVRRKSTRWHHGSDQHHPVCTPLRPRTLHFDPTASSRSRRALPLTEYGSRTKMALLNTQDVPIESVQGGPSVRFGWENRSYSDSGRKVKFSRLFKRGQSTESTSTNLTRSSSHVPGSRFIGKQSREGYHIHSDDLPFQLSRSKRRKIFSILLLPFTGSAIALYFVIFMFLSCVSVRDYSAPLWLVMMTGLGLYIGIYVLVAILLAPFSTWFYRWKLWLSSRQRRILKSRINRTTSKFPMRRSIKSRNTILAGSIPTATSGDARPSGDEDTLSQIVWTRQMLGCYPQDRMDNRPRADTLCGESETPKLANLELNDVLRAISQPNIGVIRGEKLMRRPLPIVEELETEESQSSNDHDNGYKCLVSKEVMSANLIHRAGAWCQKLYYQLCKFNATPAAVISSIVRNLTWCIIFLWKVSSLARPSPDYTWNYGNVPETLKSLDGAFQWQMTIDYCISFIVSAEKLRFALYWQSLIDLATLPSFEFIIQLLYGQNNANYSVMLGAIRFFRLFRVENLLKSVLPRVRPVPLIIVGLIIDTLIVLTSFATLMYHIEGPQPNKSFHNIADYIYYSVVTMTTVGYGDYTPTTRLGRWVTVVAVLAGFVIFPYHVQRLFNAFQISPTVVGSMPSWSSDFIFIYGKGIMLHELNASIPEAVKRVLVITPFPALSFENLVKRSMRDFRTTICVSHKCPTNEEIQLFCSTARAVFIVADPRAGDVGDAGTYSKKGDGNYAQLMMEDQKAFLRLAKVQPWCWPDVPISVQLAHGTYNNLSTEMGAYHVVSLESLKMKCLAKSVADCPGFIPLVFNWFHHPLTDKTPITEFINKMQRRKGRFTGWFSSQSSDNLRSIDSIDDRDVFRVRVDSDTTAQHHYPRQLQKARTSRDADRLIEDEFSHLSGEERDFFYYVCGMEYHVYRCELPPAFIGLSFSTAVRLLYEKFHVFLIGMISVDKRFLLNPIGFVIGTESSSYELAGIVLAQGLSDIQKILSIKSLSKVGGDISIKISQNDPAMIKAANRFLKALDNVTNDQAKNQPLFATEHKEQPLDISSVPIIPDQESYDTQIPSPIAPLVTEASPSKTSESGVCRTKFVTSRGNPYIPAITSVVDEFLTKKGPLILCCGWPKDLFTLLNSLSISDVNNVIFLATFDAPCWMRWNQDVKEFSQSAAWLHGSPLNMDDLKNAGALLADAIIICSSGHSFTPDESNDVSTTSHSPVDYQNILVRQQILALFARVDDYLNRLDSQMEADGTIGSNYEGTSTKPKLSLPLIITELYERENLEYLSSPKDLFLISALRKVSGANRTNFPKTLIRLNQGDTEIGDDEDWALEGGRNLQNERLTGAALRFQYSRMPLDYSGYAIHSEYRSGRLYLREMAYPLLLSCLPISPFAIDSSLIDHLVDASSSMNSIYCPRSYYNHPSLERYKPTSQLKLIPLHRILENNTFRKVFLYYLSVESRIVVAIMREIQSKPTCEVNPMQMLRGAAAQELVISCPRPTMHLLKGDKLYILEPSQKHLIGLLYNPSVDQAFAG